MSGDRKVWNDGEALTTVELQRVADVAASSEDRVWNMLFTPLWQGPGIYDKQVYPLVPEGAFFASYTRTRMVIPGTTTGGVGVLAAFYVVGAAGDLSADANTSTFSASKQTVSQLADSQFPSSVTNGRTDLVYALVQRVATTAARKVKDPTTGNVSTQTLTIYSTATVTIGTAQGPADGTFDPPALPADSSTAWYFPLAYVKLDDGAGGAWTQGTAIAQSRITQIWDPGWIKRNRVQLARAAAIMETAHVPGANGRATTPLSDRWGASISASAILQCETDAPGVFKVFDDKNDWSRRFATIRAGYLTDSIGNAATPDGTSPAPARFDPATNVLNTFQFIGATAGARYLLNDWTVGSTEHLLFYLSPTGAIELEFTGGPLGGGGSSIYVVTIEASDQFLF